MSTSLILRALGAVVFAALLTCAAIAISRIDGPTALIWPVNAAILAAVLLTSEMTAKVVTFTAAMVGLVVGNIMMGNPAFLSLAFMLANAAEVVIALYGAEAMLANVAGNVGRTVAFAKMIAAACVAPLVSGTIAAAALTVTFPDGGGFASFLRSWYLADFLGLVLLGPAFYAIFAHGSRRSWEVALGIVMGFATLFVALIPESGDLSRFVILALSVVAALFGVRLAVGTILGVLFGFIAAQNAGMEIPVVKATGMQFLDFQILLAAVSGLALFVAFVVERRRELSQELEAALQLREQHVQEMTQLKDGVNLLSDALVIYDKDDRLAFCNDAYRAVYPDSAAAIVPSATFESILRYGLAHGQYEEARGREDEWLAERLRLHSEPESQSEQELGDGRWLRVREVTMPNGGRVGFRVDITEMKQLEAHLRTERERAVAANAAKGVFLANMSHEIRTPLNGVLGMAQALAAGELGPAQAKMTDAIIRSGDTLMRLLNDLLDLARVESGTMEFESKPFSPHDTIAAQVLLFSETATRKGLELTFDSSGMGPPEEVVGDPGRLGQVLSNLIGNAIKFTDTGSVKITGEMRETQSDLRTLKVSIRDTGPGVEPDRREAIFERFQQEDANTSVAHGGAGLGLSICRSICDRMDGSIEYKDVPEGGAEFVFEVTFPIAQSAINAA